MLTEQLQPFISEVLVVDDDPAMLRLLSMWLKRAGYAVRVATDGQVAIAEIEKKCPDFVITDWEMPGMDGLQLCHAIRDMNLMQYIYIVFITVRATQAEAIEALETGADDFLAKPVRQNELLARMNSGRRVVELERSLSLLARTDSLTGLMTQRTFFESLTREWDRAKRHKMPLSCVMLDLDFFKRINDTHGHPAGDAVLKAVAKLLYESCRSSDAVCRYGGEEFCVLLPESSEQSAAAWAGRVCEEIRELRIPAAKRDLRVTASFGAAELSEDIPIAEQLVDRADQALLCAKQSGRDRVVCFSELETGGVVDLAKSDQEAKLFEGILARHVMTPIVACLREDETVGQAAEFFLRSRINSTPVVNETGELAGMLSEKDLMGAMVSLDSWNRPVSDVMKPNVIWYDEDAPIKMIYEFLCRVSIRRVVISKNDCPTGTISRSTLLRWFRNLVITNGHWEMDDELKRTVKDDPYRSKQRLGMTAKALSELALDLAGHLESGGEDLVPFVVGGASRMQELVYDLLAYSRYANEGTTSGTCSAMLQGREW
ncbi:MAG: diguanylate cyclase [Planctomycetota bacterium]|nr:diguanylate cyclase [Planctomycetota bacterium]